MADTLPPLVAPMAAERYAALERLGDVIAPPYDVISPAARAAFAAQSPENIVHVMLPEGNGDCYARAAARLDQWRRAGVLVRDRTPGVYVLQQEFPTPDGRPQARVGVFAAVAAEPYATGRVRPHERTHAGPKADRLSLLRATRTMVESLLLLAPDRAGELRRLLQAAVAEAPMATAELDGVRNTVWLVAGAPAEAIAAAAGRKPVYIADGHHRFETAVAYRKENPKAERTVALVVPLGDPGLVVLPTHRLVRGRALEEAEVRAALERQFVVEPREAELDPSGLLAELGSRGTAALVALPGGWVFSVILRGDADLSRVGAGRADQLAIARVDALVVGPLAQAAGGATVDYTAEPAVLFEEVASGGAAAGILLNPTHVDDVLAVADAGEFMPPKSTYFVPKVPSGVVLLPVE
ncbi:MAG: DUF1015 domain-containing protein [Gemmatimonadetes bacterium]|nr:DUF1015 domain-containing protein [Gemmatimonadota bacterium]